MSLRPLFRKLLAIRTSIWPRSRTRALAETDLDAGTHVLSLKQVLVNLN